MAIVAAAIVPHNPLLLPNIPNTNSELFATTKKVLDEYKAKIQSIGIDTIVMISSQTPRLPRAWGVNFSPEVRVDFKEYGDLATDIHFKTDMSLTQHIKEFSESKIDIQAFYQQTLDYGAAVPLVYFMTDTKPYKIVHISLSHDTLEQHFAAGQVMQKKLDTSSKRIAVLVSTHLSHERTAAKLDSIAEPTRADALLLESIRDHSESDLENIDPELLAAHNMFGHESIALLYGLLSTKNYSFSIKTYQLALGTGHVVAVAEL